MSDPSRTLKVAIPKGSLQDPTIELLAKAGYEIELTDPDLTIRPGALVMAKVHCQWRTSFWWVKRAIVTAMDIGLY